MNKWKASDLLNISSELWARTFLVVASSAGDKSELQGVNDECLWCSEVPFVFLANTCVVFLWESVLQRRVIV